MYLRPRDLKEISFEITTRCNAACPMCSRYRVSWEPEAFDTRAPSPGMPLADFPLDLFVKRFDASVLSRVKTALFNGKLGDPLMHPDALEIFRHIRRTSESTNIVIYTNGSLGTPAFWCELAAILGPGDTVVFSIDGLEDTNAIYRQRTSWSRIMSSCSMFIGAGGSAVWDYLVFRHNEHQIEEALALSRRLGFRAFELRRTNRFKGREHFDYTATDGRRARISVPLDPALVYEHHEDYLDRAPARVKIQCDFRQASKIFVSFAGKVWPCSFISEYFPETDAVRMVTERYGPTFNDLRYHGLDEILAMPYFANDLEKSWKTGQGLARECWRKCTRANRNITSIEEITSREG